MPVEGFVYRFLGAGIGTGKSGTCGTVIIGGTTYYDGTDFQNGGISYLAASPFIYQP